MFVGQCGEGVAMAREDEGLRGVIKEPVPPVRVMGGYRCQEVCVSGSEPREVCKDLWDE